ncbi:NAD-dependent epimerase/dehydratase family protein [Sporichthya polymorpha]|uniref:NAD-dependent epimerase/dehydratase family protein n=1 Tax=Sporichthya polymorpha TaxID=35751 RepID=UPI00035E3C59|nr:NAD-dependent epimerase/dehydratase family protein [Sporichthya polymorpha]
MRVLVTGATGAFGAPLCEALVAGGVEVLGMARRRPANFPAGAEFVPGDIRDANAVDAAVAKADRVVHLAWFMGVAKDREAAERINLDGTRNVIAAARRHGTEKLIFSSSVTAYGVTPGHGPYREDDERRPDPELQYAHHKMVVEDELLASGVPLAMVRPNIVIGRSVSSMSVAVLATPVLVGVRGEENPFQFVHQDDVMRFLYAVTTGERTGLVNLADSGTASLERVGEILGRRVVRFPAGMLGRSMDAMFRLGLSDVDSVALDMLQEFPVADTTALREQWGFRTTWSMEDALRDTRRAIAGVNVLGTKSVRRRDAPVLPPVGGALGSVASLAPAVVRTVSDILPASPFRDDLLARAAGGWVQRRSHDRRHVAVWAQRETALLLGPRPGADDPQVAVGRVHQLSDLLVDLVALATDEPAVLPQVRTVAEALERAVPPLASAVDREPWAAPLGELVSAVRTGPTAWR